MDRKKALEIIDSNLIMQTPQYITEDCRDALIIARKALVTENAKCERCLFYIPSEIYGIGKCSYKNRDETVFEDDFCSRREVR